MDNVEVVKIGHARCDLGKLNIFVGNRSQGGTVCGLTNFKRFAVIFDLVYRSILPFGIHSVRMRKRRWSMTTETPTRGKILR